MFASIRRFAKSKAGSFILLAFVAAIALSFAAGDVQNVLSGGGGGAQGELVDVGSSSVTERDLSTALERELTELRKTNPAADYSMLGAAFDPVLSDLIDRSAFDAFAAKHGFVLSQRLVGAEISRLPGAKGLDGKFSEQAYRAFLAQIRTSDAEVRREIATALMRRLLLVPVGTNARVPIGVATPYASMLLERREGLVGLVPIDPFRAGLTPTDADIQRFYAGNARRYMVPEQRILRYARIGPEQVAGIRPSDSDIAAYYKANQAAYAAKDTRVLSQAVVQDRAAAEGIAARAKGGQAFAAAAAPAGFAAGDVALGSQAKAQFASTAGAPVADAVFGAASGAVVGPIRSNLGWHVVKVESIEKAPARSLAQATSEIIEKLSVEKRKEAIEALVDKMQEAIDGGGNITEAAAAARVALADTPLIVVNGTSLRDAAYKLPAELAPILKPGFDMTADEDPVIETLGNDGGYIVIAPAQVVAAAPAPLASIRDRVAADWTNQQARQRAQAVANAIATKTAAGMPLDLAMKSAGVPLPPVQNLSSRRIEITQMQGQVPPPVAMLFSLSAGKSRLVADPQGRGFFIVQVGKIIPGNALGQPGLVTQVQRDFEQAQGQEYAQQFIGAMRADVGVKRDEEAIAAARRRIIASPN